MVHDIRWVEKVKLQKCSRARVVVSGESFEYVATTYQALYQRLFSHA